MNEKTIQHNGKIILVKNRRVLTRTENSQQKLTINHINYKKFLEQTLNLSKREFSKSKKKGLFIQSVRNQDYLTIDDHFYKNIPKKPLITEQSQYKIKSNHSGKLFKWARQRVLKTQTTAISDKTNSFKNLVKIVSHKRSRTQHQLIKQQLNSQTLDVIQSQKDNQLTKEHKLIVENHSAQKLFKFFQQKKKRKLKLHSEEYSLNLRIIPSKSIIDNKNSQFQLTSRLNKSIKEQPLNQNHFKPELKLQQTNPNLQTHPNSVILIEKATKSTQNIQKQQIKKPIEDCPQIIPEIRTIKLSDISLNCDSRLSQKPFDLTEQPIPIVNLKQRTPLIPSQSTIDQVKSDRVGIKGFRPTSTVSGGKTTRKVKKLFTQSKAMVYQDTNDLEEVKYASKENKVDKSVKEQMFDKQKLDGIQKNIEYINCTGQVAGYCAELLGKKAKEWLVPSLLLYRYCMKFNLDYKDAFLTALNKGTISQQQYSLFEEQNTVLTQNFNKIYQKCKKKNLITDEIEGFMNEYKRSMKKNQQFFNILLQQIALFVKLCLEDSQSQKEQARKLNQLICSIRMILAFLKSLKMEFVHLRPEMKSQNNLIEIPDVNFENLTQKQAEQQLTNLYDKMLESVQNLTKFYKK